MTTGYTGDVCCRESRVCEAGRSMEGKTGGDHQARELAFRPAQRVQRRERYVKRVRG
jgi:hypothetical protein